MDGWMDGWMDGGMDGWMDGWMEGWTDGRMDGWMDGWMDGQSPRYNCAFPPDLSLNTLHTPQLIFLLLVHSSLLDLNLSLRQKGSNNSPVYHTTFSLWKCSYYTQSSCERVEVG